MTAMEDHEPLTDRIASALVVLPCTDLDETVAFFREQLGFRLISIAPADDPRRAVLEGYGLRLQLRRGLTAPPGVLRLLCCDQVSTGATSLVAPNGTRIEVADAEPALVIPPVQQSYVVSRADADASWVVGRAGMHYRDLLPDRQGGRFIASHIAIPAGGPVPDYVHFHRIRFQLIYCHRGWVRVVYEHQGEPFVLHAGDCVLQPPEIRHRVLEASPGLEVVEISCPSEHVTFVEHELSLPTGVVRPDRDFGGQRFVHHVAAEASWEPWRFDGFEQRDTGIAAATDGLAGVVAVRPVGPDSATTVLSAPDAELLFLFVLNGAVTVTRPDERGERLGVGDSVAIPAAQPFTLGDCSADLELLEVSLPAASR
jgi:mannose-6-phosphate isomerase-like protein (cupin superfamily)